MDRRLGRARPSLAVFTTILMMTGGVAAPEEGSPEARSRGRLAGQWRLDPHDARNTRDHWAAMREAMGRFEVARVLSITQTESEVIIIEDDGLLRGRTLRPVRRGFTSFTWSFEAVMALLVGWVTIGSAGEGGLTT